MGGEALAPGFRFHPTDEELVGYYLKRKICGKPFRFDAISEIDIYRSEPWDLPGYSKLKSRDLEWYFFSALDKKYGNGWRTNRATNEGYWKTTGKDRTVRRGDRCVGMKKTLVFHIGRAPKGERTNWVMHEYRLEDEDLKLAGISQDAFVLCRIFHKSGSGPRNGDQYGAPLVEEEWEDDDVLVKERAEAFVYAEEQNEIDQCIQRPVEEVTNFAIPIPTENVLPEGYVGENSFIQLADPTDLLQDEQKPFLGTGENYNVPEATEEQFLDLLEEFHMDSEPVENEYFELDDLLNSVDGYRAGDPDSTEPTYLDASSLEQPFANESFVEVDDLNPIEADLSGFEMLDDYMSYFDATDTDLNFVALDSSKVLEDEHFSSNQVSLHNEVYVRNGETRLVPAEPSTAQGDEGASSSEPKPEIRKVAPDVQCNGGWNNNTLAKQLSCMLEAFSAPPAFASEFPTKNGISLRDTSATHSSSSVHVTAGMIHVTVSGSRKGWSLGKSAEDSDFLLPYSVTGDAEISFERNIFSSKVGSMVMRSTCYFMFLWVLVLSMSYKIGSYIYAKA
ncbi:hypothetical protein GIB67_017198 [Kingdonia uniflora]|uniref:NAC domain-containing protein n=1 Tax=Kingdonia uniflora TaxID=39325 RepID=A0A7J7NKS5_9MAGN|nr:hypothetical protein GIB67_017198 [Kingdonia uniflora]